MAEGPEPRIRHAHGRRFAWAIFPITVVLLFCGFVGLDLNGSSIGLFSADPAGEGLVAGAPRPVRSDEYLLQTPLAISSVEQGLPTSVWIGLSRADQVVAPGGGPTLDWSMLLKPQNWGYALLGASRGLAWYWWWPLLVGLGGCYALIGFVTRRWILSAALAVAAVLMPYTAWWNGSALFVGYATLAGAAMVGSWFTRRRWLAGLLAVVTGLLAAALVFAIYPPWQVSLVWLVAALGIGLAVDRRAGARRIGWTTPLAVIVAAVFAALWYLQNNGALQAMAGTYYPGQRQSEAGTASLQAFLSAPLNFWMAGRAGDSLGALGHTGPSTNLSEVSAGWLPLPVLALLIAGSLLLAIREFAERRRSVPAARPAPEGPVWTLLLLALVTLLMLAWSFLPLPSWFGSITLLQRVQPSRLSLALGVGSVLFAAVATTVKRRPVVWSWPWLLGSAVVTAALTVWSAASLPWDTELVPMRLAALSGFVLGGFFAWLLSGRGIVAAAGALAVYALVGWAPVSPLQRGIGPLSQDPLVRELTVLTKDDGDARAEVFGDFGTVAKVRASGLQSISGMTPYPDAALMKALAPRQEALWNNYAQYQWLPVPEGTSPTIARVTGSYFTLEISACDPVITKRIAPDWAISEQALDGSCLAPASTVAGEGGRSYHIYRIVRP